MQSLFLLSNIMLQLCRELEARGDESWFMLVFNWLLLMVWYVYIKLTCISLHLPKKCIRVDFQFKGLH